MHYTPPKNLLKQRIILVTGASAGIGREAALTYARFGAQLVLLGRTESKLQAVQAKIAAMGSLPAHIVTLDLLHTTPAQCQQVADDLTAQIPRLDGVLHNAGVLGDIAPMIELSMTMWQEVMHVNVNATVMLTQALLPLLLRSHAGTLVFTSSSVGRTGRANWGAYAVSKFATEGIMQVLADEYRSRNLRVNCINPGGTRSKMRAAAFPHEDSNKLKTPADIMPLYLYLMGDDSRFKTGMTFDAQPHRKPGAIV
ncbi:putative predicted oxoacyl-(acyl carrier protein) reductase, EmrKY-TolC system [Serratia symbiotica str. Tucson]|uniref:Putative predicted oxoacyl-(Acyl carrier protein) reductase, EmrKY-TolC system n=1 Tax=Serratia symbiotica str. Tucson TaxID=914128 RepID=E9CPT4_9GAMM|nr:YciK family oxidoreductase [Serratia symbiotica]EFW11490.1 putative predicted oxoacyl-(acyl carrier protein) reductase, EmrKY-TolC system [Serratia symbiotica str. Tucson]